MNGECECDGAVARPLEMETQTNLLFSILIAMGKGRMHKWSHRKKRRVTRVDAPILAVVQNGKTRPDDFIIGTYDRGRCISCYEPVVEEKYATKRHLEEKRVARPHPWYEDDPSSRMHKFLGGILTCEECFEFLKPGSWWEVRSDDRACLLCGTQGRLSPLVLLSLSLSLSLSVAVAVCRCVSGAVGGAVSCWCMYRAGAVGRES
jgi:hypothetical protein